MLTLGEVHTTTLMHSSAATSVVARRLLSLTEGAQVSTFERPNSYALSPESLVGVDCEIPTTSGARVRGVGTLIGRVALTGGRVVQASVVARIEQSEASERCNWSHYLARPGVVETIGRTDAAGVGEAHLVASPSASTMGIGAVCGRLLARVQESARLDRRPPFVAGRTILRWAAAADRSGDQLAQLSLDGDEVRTIQVSDVPDAVALCEDIALHDWLLSTLLSMIERSRIGTGELADVVGRLRPAVDHLLHLWMPGARLSGGSLKIWRSLERSAGLSRQWETSVQRIRDQISMARC